MVLQPLVNTLQTQHTTLTHLATSYGSIILTMCCLAIKQIKYYSDVLFGFEKVRIILGHEALDSFGQYRVLHLESNGFGES